MSSDPVSSASCYDCCWANAFVSIIPLNEREGSLNGLRFGVIWQDFFKRLGAGAAGAAARFSTEQAHAQTLLARIESSALLEDKKRAIEELQEHLQKFPSVVRRAGIL